ncbi:MAG: hypothetical protein RMM58_01865 [Chloroflexota bacterium]|nr:hypothetical protein [Dehalococcoidia bacterium]MDW8252603.1 hypothetical protein [Chloroflexota bacterium]
MNDRDEDLRTERLRKLYRFGKVDEPEQPEFDFSSLCDEDGGEFVEFDSLCDEDVGESVEFASPEWRGDGKSGGERGLSMFSFLPIETLLSALGDTDNDGGEQEGEGEDEW